VPRGVYGEYIGGLLHDQDAAHRLNILRDECVGIIPSASSVQVMLASGDEMQVDYVVLATGNEPGRPTVAGRSENPWAPGVLDRLDGHATVLVVGTGLTMVDVVLSLYRRGHRGPIVAISRRGLLSQPHQLAPAQTLRRDEISFGAPLSVLMRWLRDRIRTAEQEQSADWRSVIDALRPYIQDLWHAMSIEQRGRFLRHARPWWDVRRHRMAPQISELIKNLRAEGRLRIFAARIIAAQAEPETTKVTLRHRGGDVTETIEVGGILDCTGLPDDPRHSLNPALASLFAAGHIRPGPLTIGLDLAANGAVIATDGSVSPRVFAVGPLSRGVRWESIALPDIRDQCAELASRLAALVAKVE